MVKGVTRQVILVKSPDPKLFEQAIFFVKDEALADGVDAEQVLKQARRAADSYVKEGKKGDGRLGHVPGALWCGAGMVAASVCWTVWLFLL